MYSLMNNSDHVCALLIDRGYWTEAVFDLIESQYRISVRHIPVRSLFGLAMAHLINVQCY